MRAFRFATLTDLHDGLCDELIHAPREKLDLITSVDVQIHNTMSYARSMSWNFDLKTMWLTKARWNMMVKQYCDPDDLKAWLQKCIGGIGTKGRGVCVMRTKLVKPRGGNAYGNKETRRWGSCMLALGYKALPQPQITLYSRTSYLGYIGALDLSVAWMAARYMAREMGLEPKDFSFLWYNTALQWHNFKSLAYLLNHRDPEKRTEYRQVMMRRWGNLTEDQAKYVQSSPALTMSRTWLQKVVEEDRHGKTLGDMTYNTYRRIRRRYHTEVKGYEYAKRYEGWSFHKKGEQVGEKKEFFRAYQPLPSCMIETCDFKAAGLPWNRALQMEPSTGDADYEEDDDYLDED